MEITDRPRRRRCAPPGRIGREIVRAVMTRLAALRMVLMFGVVGWATTTDTGDAECVVAPVHDTSITTEDSDLRCHSDTTSPPIPTVGWRWIVKGTPGPHSSGLALGPWNSRPLRFDNRLSSA